MNHDVATFSNLGLLLFFFLLARFHLDFDFSGAYTLALAFHVPLLSFLRFGEILIDVLDCEEWPCDVVVVSNCFESRAFCRETSRGVKIADGELNAWHVIDIVDVLSWVRAAIQQYT